MRLASVGRTSRGACTSGDGVCRRSEGHVALAEGLPLSRRGSGQDKEFAATRQQILAFAKDTNDADDGRACGQGVQYPAVHRQGGARRGTGARLARGWS